MWLPRLAVRHKEIEGEHISRNRVHRNRLTRNRCTWVGHGRQLGSLLMGQNITINEYVWFSSDDKICVILLIFANIACMVCNGLFVHF